MCSWKIVLGKRGREVNWKSLSSGKRMNDPCAREHWEHTVLAVMDEFGRTLNFSLCTHTLTQVSSQKELFTFASCKQQSWLMSLLYLSYVRVLCPSYSLKQYARKQFLPGATTAWKQTLPWLARGLELRQDQHFGCSCAEIQVSPDP